MKLIYPNVLVFLIIIIGSYGNNISKIISKEKEPFYRELKKTISYTLPLEKSKDYIIHKKEYKTIESKNLTGLNFWTIFFFSISVLGVFFSLIINLRNKGDAISNLMIGLLILSHSLFMMYLSKYISKLNPNPFYELLFISTIFSVLNGPLLYFYFKRISEKYQLRVKDLFHLLPLLVVLIYLLPTYQLSFKEKLNIISGLVETSDLSSFIVLLFQLISLSAYAFLVYLVYKNKVNKKKKSQLLLTLWQRNIMLLNIFYTMLYFAYSLLIMRLIKGDSVIYFLALSISLIILYVGYTAYATPDLFSKAYLFKEHIFFKYKKSGLTKSYSEELRSQLQNIFDEEKIYRDSSLSLEDLANKLGTTRHNISQIINEHFEMNFFQFVNKYRIAEAVEILKHDDYRNLKIINIAYDVGFNNKVTFNKAFKMETKMTPSVFLEQIRKR